MAKRVPAKLHHELVEYASLLRALRVRDTLDVTKHLTRTNPFKLQPDDGDAEQNSDGDEEAEDDDSASASRHSPSVSLSRTQTPDPGPSNPKSAKARGKQKAVDSGVRKQRRRDHWTRWPVRVDDVLKPEWSLEDEVAVIVAQVMKGRPSPVFPVPVDAAVDGADEDDPVFPVRNFEFDEEDPDHPFYVPYITANVADYLSNILGALACLVPARAASMQNRIEPLGWRTVIDVIVACTPPEFANPKVVENVIKRMEALYGPSILALEGDKSTSFRAVERMLDKEAALRKLNDKLDKVVAKYWETPEMPDTQQQKETKKRKRPVIEEHMDAEFKGRLRPVIKRKRRKASVTNKKAKRNTAIPGVAADSPGTLAADAQGLPAAMEIQAQGKLLEQAGSSHQGHGNKAPGRRSTRSRRITKFKC